MVCQNLTVVNCRL